MHNDEDDLDAITGASNDEMSNDESEDEWKLCVDEAAPNATGRSNAFKNIIFFEKGISYLFFV